MAPIENISKAEALKQLSRQLRGNLAEDLADTAHPFDNAGYSLLKFHGIYQGYDRDSATERKQRGDDKIWQFMVRVRIPGGRLTADQYLALDEHRRALRQWLAAGHDAPKHPVPRRFEAGSQGDHRRYQPCAADDAGGLRRCRTHGDDGAGAVPRCGAPPARRRRAAAIDAPVADDRRISRDLGRRREDRAANEETPDPLYGERYLPRKFKIGLAIPEDNTIDVLTNDLAIVALFAGDQLQGYNFLLGGGHGMTHNKPETYPRLATAVAFIMPDDLLNAAAAVVRLHRDWGDRGNRRHARLKYVIAERGEEWARERLSTDLGKPLTTCRPMPDFQVPDHLGWHQQGDGRLYLGLPVASGRIVDSGSARLRSALREIVGRFRCEPILMPSQDIILSDIDPADRTTITALAQATGVRLAEELLPVERWALACPALPSCGLALTEAERVREDIVGAIAERLKRWGLEHERLSVRITGCPNGCARPYNGDIGIVGRVPGFYSLYVGGDFEGTRLNAAIAERLDIAGIADALDTLFARFARARLAGEAFGDFCHRIGHAAVLRDSAEAQRAA